jgi:hypothetical protein
VTVVDDRDHQQRQAHLASAKYCGIHSAYGNSAGHKYADENNYSSCKNRVEIAFYSIA